MWSAKALVFIIVNSWASLGGVLIPWQKKYMRKRSSEHGHMIEKVGFAP
jgi:hypothetical protein